MNDTLIRRGLTALSGDPITKGHLDLFARSADQCQDEIVIAVMNNPDKAGKYTFAIDERLAMAKRAIAEAGIRKTRVIRSEGLLVDVYLREGCDGLFRGIRNDNDLVYEKEQAEINGLILPQLTPDRIKLIKATPALRLVSSSMAKMFVGLQLDVDTLVPMFVKQMLEERLLGQFRLGLTGGISVGKTWVGEELARQANLAGLSSTHINVDRLLRDFYEDPCNGAQIVRDQLAHRFFRKKILSEDRKSVDRKCLADLLFREGAEADREFVQDLTMPYVAMQYRQALKGAKGLIIVEWAQMAEMDMGPWTNNNVLVVDSSDRATLLAKRNIDPARMAIMDTLQLSAGLKTAKLSKRAAKDKSGTVVAYDNRVRATEAETQADVKALLSEIRARCFPYMPGGSGD